MKIRELRVKSVEELKRLYQDLCQRRQELNFKLAGQQLKKVRDLRNLKKDIARVISLLNESKNK